MPSKRDMDIASSGGGGENLVDGGGVGRPPARSLRQLCAPRARELIELGFAVVLGESPLGLDPLPLLHPVERGVESALFYREGPFGGLPDPLSDGVAVAGTPGEGLEDEHIERALEEIEVGGHCFP